MGGFNFKEPKRLQTLSALVNGLTEAAFYRTQTAQQPCAAVLVIGCPAAGAGGLQHGDKYHDSDSSVAARFMFKKAGVKLTAYQSTGRKAELEL